MYLIEMKIMDQLTLNETLELHKASYYEPLGCIVRPKVNCDKDIEQTFITNSASVNFSCHFY